MARRATSSVDVCPPAVTPSELREKIHRLEAHVREQEDIERQYRTLINQMPDLVARVDRHLVYLDVNSRFCEVFGILREELIGQTVGTVRPDVGLQWAGLFRDVIAAGEEREVAFAYDTPDGRRWFETRLVPEVSTGGAVVSVLAVARDVTDRRQADLAREASEAQLRLLLDQAPAILWTADLDLRFTSLAGAALAGITGPVAPLIGQRIADSLRASPDDPPMVAHRRALAGEAVEYDLRFDSHDYRCRIEPFRDSSGEVIGVIGVSLDVTQLKAAEAELRELNTVLEARVAERTSELDQAVGALRQSEAMFRALLEQMPDGLYVTELEEGEPLMRIILANEAAARMQGCSREELIGRSFISLCANPVKHEELADRIRRLRGGEIVRIEGHYRRNDGRVFPMDLTARLVQYGGRSVAMGLVRDVTERRAAEAQLRLVQSAVDQVTDSVIITDADLDAPGPRIIYVNPAFEAMTGYAAAEVIGKSPRVLQGPDSDRATLRLAREHLVRGEPFDGEVTNYRKDGTPYTLAWHMAPIRNESGEVINWVAIQRDVSEARRQAELQRQHQAELAHVSRLSMMGEMASGLAHELNQPLAAIANYARGGLRLMEGRGLDEPDVQLAFERIAAQADRSGQIIQRMRQFVRKRELQRSAIEPNELVREAMTLIEPDIAQRRVSLQLDLAPGLPRLNIDTIQVEQVLINLLRNGIEAMAELPVSQRLLVVRSQAEKSDVVLSVEDAGAGLEQRDFDRIFDPFFTTKPRGMGMGLTISRTIVEAHGGRLWAQRNPTRGMTFFLSLPRSTRDGP